MDAHYAAHDPTDIGVRIRELRAWRGLSLRACAELSGVSYSHLGKIERGDAVLQNRFQLDMLARTLRVSPTELAGYPYSGDDGSVAEAHRALDPMRAVTVGLDLADDPTVHHPRELPTLLAEARYISRDRVECRHSGIGDRIAPVVRELHAHTYTATGADLRSAYAALAETYEAVRVVAKHHGAGDLASLASVRVQALAEKLSEPEWWGLAQFSRVQALGSADRDRGRQIAADTARELDGYTGEAAEMRGMAHLNAALASAALGDYDIAAEHVDHAADIATHVEPSGFGWLHFGAPNVRLWKLAIAVERGDTGTALDLGEEVVLDELPTTRQVAYWQDYGQALAAAKRREGAIRAFSHAERLAPARTRLNPLVRETVTDLLRQVRRDSEGRELRGLAYRMAITPSG